MSAIERQQIARLRRIHQMNQLIRSFLNSKSAATAIEYGIVAAGISVAIVTVLGTTGTNLNATFTTVATAIK
jgi:pilus assembly protein Flp/PilA